MTELVVTNSLLKTFRQCPRQAMYKHVDLLTPRVDRSKPLKRGTWIHALLEAKYKGESVKARHQQLTHEFGKLFDEEKEALGNLPVEVARLFNSYNWHYAGDKDWTVHEVEFKLEGELPNGIPIQGKSDMLVEDQFGLWVVDHKSHAVIPSVQDRLLDPQSVIYLWLCQQAGIPVRGFIWNYLVTKPPAIIKLTKAGEMYKRQGPSDYPTALASLKKETIDRRKERGDNRTQDYTTKYADFLEHLKAQRYVFGETQTSPFFRRDRIEKDEAMIERALAEVSHTAERYRDYPFNDRDAVERNVGKSCNWCAFRSLCTAELIGGNVDNVRRQEYKKHDPFAYYEEERGLS